jgi:hypothetical protein
MDGRPAPLGELAAQSCPAGPALGCRSGRGPASCACAPIQVAGQCANSWILEQFDDRRILTETLGYSIVDHVDEHGMSAEIEEIVQYADGGKTEDLNPDIGYGPFRRRDRRALGALGVAIGYRLCRGRMNTHGCLA